MEHDGRGSQRGFDDVKLESATRAAVSILSTYPKFFLTRSYMLEWYVWMCALYVYAAYIMVYDLQRLGVCP